MLSYSKNKLFDIKHCILSVSSLKHRHTTTDYAFIAAHLDVDVNLAEINTIIVIPSKFMVRFNKHNTKQTINEYVKRIDIQTWFDIVFNMRNCQFVTKEQLSNLSVMLGEDIIDKINKSKYTSETFNNTVNILNNIKDFNHNYNSLLVSLPKAIETKDLITINNEINNIKSSIKIIQAILDDDKYKHNFDDLFEI